MEILKYTLPALMVVIAVGLVLYKMLKEDEKRRLYELKRESLKTINPARLHAYERFALVLERTQPANMLPQMQLAGLTAQQLHQQLLQKIRLEFDHNASQQIYVSDMAWEQVLNARENLFGLINTAANYIKPEQPAMEFAKIIIEAYATNGETASEKALAFLKNEVREMF